MQRRKLEKTELAVAKETLDGERSFQIDDDLYSTNLTQGEIQGHLKLTNKEIALENVVEALRSKNEEILKLSMDEIGIKQFKPVLLLSFLGYFLSNFEIALVFFLD